MTTLTEQARDLLDGKNFATIATLNEDGSPHTSVIWVTSDGDDVLFTTRADRRKARNVARDPRVSISLFDTANPYRTSDIRGIAELVEDPGNTLGNRLSHEYVGEDAPPEPPEVVRYIVRVRPHKVIDFAV
ncbi:PPOX class probable F420-dependent enzyme [Herbihabitans rhizosphaerae]|uniref:PPOX class probable F420-dependent enzyme n=1 Tax=Herbihabitans rhizosphaerae TaxID=1872711 RepID=A0A4Q7KW97_9PSEU|nr:PPOX class F420-dependent oxidoreductase [Herbihabitans rhizosphaerae]RZS41329.1 PPOX class probable F420-dependent enzyme [Herbihabitans rhizosphaerae]